jgi:hypothetical protein
MPPTSKKSGTPNLRGLKQDDDSSSIIGAKPVDIIGKSEAESELEPEDDDSMLQGLTPDQIAMLAHRVYDLLLDELRIEAERYGRIVHR